MRHQKGYPAKHPEKEPRVRNPRINRTRQKKEKRTRHLPADPERKNAARARWAGQAVQEFRAATGTDKQDALANLLGNLMHWADRNKLNYVAELARGRRYYTDETASTSAICWQGTRPLLPIVID